MNDHFLRQRRKNRSLAYYRGKSRPRVPICGWISRVNGEILTDDQTYNRDGAMNYRYLRPQGIGPTVPYTREWFHYGYNDRLIKMQTDATGMKTERYPEGCVVGAPYSLSFSLANRMEWQYSYSPSGEREIKRLVLSPTSVVFQSVDHAAERSENGLVSGFLSASGVTD